MSRSCLHALIEIHVELEVVVKDFAHLIGLDIESVGISFIVSIYASSDNDLVSVQRCSKQVSSCSKYLALDLNLNPLGAVIVAAYDHRSINTLNAVDIFVAIIASKYIELAFQTAAAMSLSRCVHCCCLSPLVGCYFIVLKAIKITSSSHEQETFVERRHTGTISCCQSIGEVFFSNLPIDQISQFPQTFSIILHCEESISNLSDYSVLHADVITDCESGAALSGWIITEQCLFELACRIIAEIPLIGFIGDRVTLDLFRI